MDIVFLCMIHVCTCRMDSIAILILVSCSIDIPAKFPISLLFYLQTGASPLLYLVKNEYFYRGSFKVVEKLLKFGADPNLKDKVHLHITLYV